MFPDTTTAASVRSHRSARGVRVAGLAILALLSVGLWSCDSDRQTSGPIPEESGRPVAQLSPSEPGAEEGSAAPEPDLGPPLEPEPPRWPPEALGDFELDLDDVHLDDELGRYVAYTDSGLQLVLTLDPGLQEHLTTVTGRYDEPAQAVVVVEPSTGRVLAFVEATNLIEPVENPARSAVPWAASTFKIVTGAALLDVGVNPDREYCVSPARRGVELADLEEDADRDSRCVDMAEAMARSTNVYFARLSDRHLSAGLLNEWLERFGFNAAIPFEIPIELSAAEVPDSRLERARMSAGFRHSHQSPLHGALIASAVANDGNMMAPTLIERVLDRDGTELHQHEPRVLLEVMSESLARRLSRVMGRTTVTGTAARYFEERSGWPSDLVTSGKTGTLSNRSDEDPNPDPYLIYTWFVGFGARDVPHSAVAAVVYSTETWYIKGSYLASEAVLYRHNHLPSDEESRPAPN